MATIGTLNLQFVPQWWRRLLPPVGLVVMLPRTLSRLPWCLPLAVRTSNCLVWVYARSMRAQVVKPAEKPTSAPQDGAA